MKNTSSLRNSLGKAALAALLLALAPHDATAASGAENEKKPVPVQPEKQPEKKAAQDTFEDEPIDTPVKKDAANTTAGAAKTGPKVLVLPLQPIYRSVAQNKIEMANNLLLKELDQKDLQIIRGGVSKGDLQPASIEGVQKAIDDAEKAEASRDIHRAIAARKKTIEEMEKNAAAVDPDRYVEAHHWLARAYMWAGEDKSATDTLDTAARMRPGFSLKSEDYSRLYRKWFLKAAEKALADKPGELMVRSGLPGAAIMLDGRPMDVAPVVLKKVVPGRHLIGAKIEGVPYVAAIVDVKGGSKNEHTVVFSNTIGGSAVGAVADAIAENAIPKKAVESAAQAGKDAGAAYVVIGGLAKDEDHFQVHAYVVDVAKSSIQALDVVQFDLDMLTAESDVLRVVQSINTAVNEFAGKDPSVAMIEKRINKQPTVNEVAAAPSLQDEGAAKRASADDKGGPKKREVFKPLKSGNVTIKDEEEDK